MKNINSENVVIFSMGDLYFEYDDNKNQKNIEKHGISFLNSARVFFDFDRIELYDENNSNDENRYQTIGNVSVSIPYNSEKSNTYLNDIQNVILVVYTERKRQMECGKIIETIRLISARYATSFEKGLYYGKYPS